MHNNKHIADWLFAFLFVFTLFSEQIFFSFLSLMGMSVESGMLQNVFILISFFCYLMLLYDILHYKCQNRDKILAFIFCFVALYYLTPKLVGVDPPKLHDSALLRFGSVGISSIILGMHLAIKRSFTHIDYILPFFIIPITYVVGSVGLRSATINELLHEESGFNYQTVSYYMAELYAYSAYCAFFSSLRLNSKFKYFRWIFFATMLFSVLICFLSGGRGAFVFIVLVTVAIAYMLLKTGRMNTKQLSITSVIVVGLFLIIATKMGLWESTGFLRITNHLTDDSGRETLQSSALDFAKQSVYLGNGLGSIWWTVGMYSHNMITDLLSELGFLGVLVVLGFIITIIKRIVIWCRVDWGHLFLLFVFLKSLTYTMFSGYWISCFQLWLIFGYVFAFDIHYQRERDY